MRTLTFIGGGPKTLGILLGLVALGHSAESDPDPLQINVVDPYPPGGGRIWRHEQSPTLWMNSISSDITVYPDPDASFPAGITPVTGPDLHTWAHSASGQKLLTQRGLEEQGKVLTKQSFASRQLQAAYLAWVFDDVIAQLPSSWHIEVFQTRATVLETGNVNRVVLETGEILESDAVVLAQGFIEVTDDPRSAQLKVDSAQEGLRFIAPDYTADLDLSDIKPGENLLVRGFGLAFIDAMMMLTEDRGGTFIRSGNHTEYRPSGKEPVLWVGSRRGVPYFPKLSYTVPGHKIARPRYVSVESAQEHLRKTGLATLDSASYIFPLLELELLAAHYTELVRRGEERAQAPVADYLSVLDAWAEAIEDGNCSDRERLRRQFDDLVEASVADPLDRFNLTELNHPLAGLTCLDHGDFERRVADYTRYRLNRAKNPYYSMDSAVFFALVSAYYQVRDMVALNFFAAEDRNEGIDSRLSGFFSYIASGPPPERLENMLALHKAGVVRFAGSDLDATIVNGRFVGTSLAHTQQIEADGLFEARLARISGIRAKDQLLQRLISSGDLFVEQNGGSEAKFLADAGGRALASDGRAHHNVFLVGPSVSGAVAEAFFRPGTDALVPRDCLRLAQNISGALQVIW